MRVITFPTVRRSVKAWQETLEETGFNPFQTDVTSILTQLSVEQDFLTGGDDNIFGETKESCLAAIDKVLERIENPLAAVTELQRKGQHICSRKKNFIPYWHLK